MISKTFKLGSLEIPQIGFGTYELRGMTCTRLLNYALSLGYKYIDTSPSFKNEHMVVLSLVRMPRQDLFLTIKISHLKLSCVHFSQITLVVIRHRFTESM